MNPRIPPRVPTKRSECDHKYDVLESVIVQDGHTITIRHWLCPYCGSTLNKEP